MPAGGLIQFTGTYTECGSIRFVNDLADPGGDGCTWEGAYKDLMDALDDASGSGGIVEEIWVASGTYTPDRGTGDRNATFELINDVAIYGGFPPAGGPFESRDPATYVTTLSGDIGIPGENSDNSYHVVTASDANSAAILDGFTITVSGSPTLGVTDARGRVLTRI